MRATAVRSTAVLATAVLAAAVLATAVPAVAGSLDRATPSPSAADEDPQVVFRIRAPDVTESSGLVASTTRRGLAYTVNDSGDDAVVYVIDTGTGELAGRTWLAGVDAYDVEALAAGGDGSLVVADIGDNSAAREQISAYRIAQPDRGDRTVTPDAVRLRYVDGPRDAESMLYDDTSGRIFVVSKEFGGAHVYRTKAGVFDRRVGVLRPVAAAPPLATDATYLTDRRYAVVRGYGNATLVTVRDWKPRERFDLPSQEQGESVAAPPDDPDVVWVGSEGERSPVHAVPVPGLPERGGDGAPGPGGDGDGRSDGSEAGSPGTPEDDSGEAGDTDSAGARSVAVWVGGVAAAGLVVALSLLLVRGRRSRDAG